MYQEQARAMQDSYSNYNNNNYNYNYNDDTRSETTEKPRKHKKSFLNILRRRESSNDLTDKKDKSDNLYKLKHKASESFLPLRQASHSSQFSKAPSQNSTSSASSKHHHHHPFPLHKSSYGYEREHPSSGSQSPRPNVRQRSKSSSYQPPPPPSKPLPPVPRLDVLPKDLLKDFRGSRMFNLDTDLNQMQGIVQQADQPSNSVRPKSSQSYDGSTLKPLTPMPNNDNNNTNTTTTNNNNDTTTATTTINDDTTITNDNAHANGQAITTDTVTTATNTINESTNLNNPPGSKWTAPESWGVVDSIDPNLDKTSNESSMTKWGDKFDQDKTIRRKTNHCLRVFREDGTFGTLSCSIDISVNELLQMLGRKFFLNSVTGYELSARTGGLTRIMEPHEKPLFYQKMLLEFMGYTENDRLGDVGREDLSYLCRFEFQRSAMKQFTPEEEALMTRDFVNVELPRMNLQTVPIVFYQHTKEIERLDVSKNPSITLPLDFIQSCINLKHLKFVDNQARRFPANIDKAQRLTSLDLSNNLIQELDHVCFTKFPSLRSLDLQGNRLNQVSTSIVYTKLTYLNLSSNNLTRIPDDLCTMVSLVELDLSFNHISALPNNIGKLQNLDKLLMTNNDLTMRLPESFQELSSLRELDVRYNKLQNIDVLARLPKLENLYCSRN